MLKSHIKKYIVKNTDAIGFPRVGSVLEVKTLVVENNEVYLKTYEGVCVSVSNTSFNTKFSIVSNIKNVKFERRFLLSSRSVVGVRVIKKPLNKVRKSKNYSLLKSLSL